MALATGDTYPKRQHQALLEKEITPPSFSKSDSRPPKYISLPYELYEKILEYAIDELVQPYERCDWLTSPSYYFKIGPFSTYGRDDTYWNYRLVCRTFAKILHYPIQKILYSTRPSIPEGVRILQIGETSDSISLVSGVISSFPACRAVTRFTFCDSSLDAHIEKTISILLYGSKALPNLRSLSLGGRLPRDFWKLLAKSFPLLIELYTSGTVRCDTPVTLEKLEILRATYIEPRSLLHCPNLKHLFLFTCPEWDTFLQSHSTHLESLLVETGTTKFHYLEIRSRFPRLRTYSGVASRDRYYTTKSFDPRCIPPPDQWCIFGTYYDANRSRNLIDTVSEVAGIRFLTLWPQMVTRQEAKTLEEVCQKRNGHVTWIDPMEHAPDPVYSVNIYHFCPEWLKKNTLCLCKGIVFMFLCILADLGVVRMPLPGG
jgi:hypothetical protein